MSGCRFEKAVDDQGVVPQPEREPVTAVGLGGGCARDCRPSSDSSFEVVVDSILNPDGKLRSVGFVRTLENNSEAGRRLH